MGELHNYGKKEGRWLVQLKRDNIIIYKAKFKNYIVKSFFF